MLKSVYLGFRKVKVQRVTVVKFGMYDRGGDGVGCLEVKVGASLSLKRKYWRFLFCKLLTIV